MREAKASACLLPLRCLSELTAKLNCAPASLIFIYQELHRVCAVAHRPDFATRISPWGHGSWRSGLNGCPGSIFSPRPTVYRSGLALAKICLPFGYDRVAFARGLSEVMSSQMIS